MQDIKWQNLTDRTYSPSSSGYGWPTIMEFFIIYTRIKKFIQILGASLQEITKLAIATCKHSQRCCLFGNLPFGLKTSVHFQVNEVMIYSWTLKAYMA